ncbi:hypothetical protein [Streptomyces lonarensis]|uniref:Uncharacterized protein n=1 Tax=Streptomyces lonarensis TaxID=700599 RepID=A0A7X6HX93_9ACTN|nr:hypothetical protein [Streptomyces lonarensis]NJQ04316.1 hypothetical protein [Streptomyces lonarensis]
MDVLWTLVVVLVGGALLAVVVNGVVRGERRGLLRRGRRARRGPDTPDGDPGGDRRG